MKVCAIRDLYNYGMKCVMADGEYLNWLLSSDDRPIPPPRRRKMERQARLLGAEPAPVPDNEFPQHVLTGRVGIMKDYVMPVGHGYEADALTFLHSMIPNIDALIEDELEEKEASSSR